MGTPGLKAMLLSSQQCALLREVQQGGATSRPHRGEVYSREVWLCLPIGVARWSRGTLSALLATLCRSTRRRRYAAFHALPDKRHQRHAGPESTRRACQIEVPTEVWGLPSAELRSLSVPSSSASQRRLLLRQADFRRAQCELVLPARGTDACAAVPNRSGGRIG